MDHHEKKEGGGNVFVHLPPPDCLFLPFLFDIYIYIYNNKSSGSEFEKEKGMRACAHGGVVTFTIIDTNMYL